MKNNISKLKQSNLHLTVDSEEKSNIDNETLEANSNIKSQCKSFKSRLYKKFFNLLTKREKSNDSVINQNLIEKYCLKGTVERKNKLLNIRKQMDKFQKRNGMIYHTYEEEKIVAENSKENNNKELVEQKDEIPFDSEENIQPASLPKIKISSFEVLNNNNIFESNKIFDSKEKSKKEKNNKKKVLKYLLSKILKSKANNN